MERVRPCPHCGQDMFYPATRYSRGPKYCSDYCALFSRVAIVDGDGCWNWTAKPDPHGYSQIGGSRGNTNARKGHRVAMELALGRPLLPEECALHTCDNRLCCRVGEGHIRLGTRAENIVECHAKGRGSRPPLPSQALTPEQHADIARRRAAGEGAKEIAASMGISRHTVYQSKRRVRATGVVRRHWVCPDEVVLIALEMRAKGTAWSAIARELNLNRGTLYARAKELAKAA